MSHIMRKPVLPYVNKDADQPAHPHSLISAFVIHCLDSIIPLVSIPKISSLWLASVAEQAGLSLTWSQTPEDRFSRDMAHMYFTEQAVEQPAETRKVTETGDITHQDDVIVIDLDSDEDAPKPKRQRLDNFNPATDQDANINSNSREIINTAEEMICDNSNNKVTNNENSVDSSNFIEQDAVDNSLENVTTKSVQHIEDKTEIELSQDKEEAIGRLKEIWHSANTSETCPAQELESLVSLTSEEMETAVKKLELTEMNENSVLTACSHLASVSELISYGNCVCFLRFALCEKVVTLTQNASRVLVSAVTMVANRYPKQLIDSVLVRCVVGSFDSPHLDLVTRLLKESFNEGTQLYFMKSFIADQELEINDSKIALIQTLLETTNIDPEIIEKILNLFERQTSKLAKNLKFGKLLLAVVTKHGKLLRGENLIKFSSIVDKHQTFVKKSVENAVKKLKS